MDRKTLGAAFGVAGVPREGDKPPAGGAPAGGFNPASFFPYGGMFGGAAGKLGQLAGGGFPGAAKGVHPATPVTGVPGGGAPPPPPGVAVGDLRLERPIGGKVFDPGIFDWRPPGLFEQPPVVFPFPPQPVPVSKTASQLARSAIVNLSDASREVLEEAINAFTIRDLRAEGLLDYLERKVRVGEVLNQLAQTWSESTLTDFAEAFRIDRARTAAMDAIVSIAILNDPELDQEILAENLPDAATEDLLDNRVIVDQWPQGGAPLNPPYLVLVAVEYRDVAGAEDVVRSLLGELAEHQGVKLPSAAVQKL
jgi:hypothetical protein